MSYSIQKQQWLVLEQELKGVECLALLREFQAAHPQFQGHESWLSVFKAVRINVAADFEANDQILIPIINTLQTSSNSNCQTVLLVMFKRALNSIWRQRSRYESDRDEVWQKIIEIFLSTIKGMNTCLRQHRFASKIVNETRHRTFEQYRKEWIRRGREESTTFEKLLDHEAEHIEETNPEEAFKSAERAIGHLREFKEQGRLDDAEYQILVDSRVLGYSIRDLAKNSNETYEALKKRRQRAESRLRETVVFAEA